MNPLPLLEVRNLSIHYAVRPHLFRPARHLIRAVNDVSFSIHPGETLGLVGESGCGKTTLGRAIVRLVKPAEGCILFKGKDITRLTGPELLSFRRQVQIVFQDPLNSLDPRLTVEDIIGEALDIHHLADSRKHRRARVHDLLRSVGLAAAHATQYPHEFSGGQRQRIGIARALAVDPQLIVCDEPVSALDVSVQAQIVNLLQDLQQQHGLAYLFIAHDLAVVRHISRKVLVMYLGKIVESAEAERLITSPRHPYTSALISSVPRLERSERTARQVLAGEPPSPVRPPTGCPFHPRCPRAEFPRCSTEVPRLRPLDEPERAAACHFA